VTSAPGVQDGSANAGAAESVRRAAMIVFFIMDTPMC
jgi:hypothetical protein